jgi:membrane associated rhomboid family serine protease
MFDFIASAPVASLVMATFVGASLLALYAAPWMIERGVFRPYWLVPRRAWATPVTSAFLHADVGHLFFNGFTFWAFGFSLERTMGSTQFATLYAVGLFASALGTWVNHRREPDYQTLGASGAILAVLFASIVYHPGSSIFILPIRCRSQRRCSRCCIWHSPGGRRGRRAAASTTMRIWRARSLAWLSSR